ncbi:hypothetical protein H5410_051435 [Solanum commersonii]|uniref:Uncharacterized protein n=1 Tax=Solanum commersonii TaxID=4109 RepID=A0A9J5X0Z0_SOLCO|nr:hypothetical protein H5410_051435 [Solanum commersonii]
MAYMATDQPISKADQVSLLNIDLFPPIIHPKTPHLNTNALFVPCLPRERIGLTNENICKEFGTDNFANLLKALNLILVSKSTVAP